MQVKIHQILAVTLFSIVLSACNHNDDDQEKKPSPTITPTSNTYGEAGCYSASYSTASSYGTIGQSFGNQYYDQKMGEEVSIQRNFWGGIPAAVYVLYEQGPEYRNAYALGDRDIILFGYYMFYYTIANYGELAASGILAHEWGHRVQYKYGWTGQSAPTELEADAFSGYYMALAKQWAWSQIAGYFSNVYAIGDYYFNNPNHHGTPAQRLAAARLGVDTAIHAMQNRTYLGYNDLHQIFSQKIQSAILASPNTLGENKSPQSIHTPEETNRAPIENEQQIIEISAGRTVGAEVRYPNIPQEELEKLFPKTQSN